MPSGSYARRSKPLIELFERHHIPEPTSGCFLWTGAVDGCGYGWIGARNRGMLRAHRVSWELHRGPIPLGMCVLHRCDNPPCVNPEHLFLGTQWDNTNDCKAKGRLNRARGTAHARNKLTEQQVREIIGGSKLKRSALAEKYNVSWTTISHIKNRKIWKHI